MVAGWDNRPMEMVTDWRGRSLGREGGFERIVCLVPSLTETIIRLGAGERLAGRTRFCVEPAGEVERIPALGGTKNPRLEKIIELRPDLVIANVEENPREAVEELEEAGIPCYVCFPRSRREALAVMEDLGRLAGVEQEAEKLLVKAEEDLAAASERVTSWPERSYIYLIWQRPYMAAGGETYISQLLSHLKLSNLLAGAGERYPVLEEVKGASRFRPDLVLLSTEPFPFTEKHIPEVSQGLAALFGYAPEDVRVVDGRWASWYGWRTCFALTRLADGLSL